jgi:hypothetical protein
MKHLTEDMLIQYAFDLLEADMTFNRRYADSIRV